MKPFSFIQFPNAKALKLKVKSRRIFKMSLLCNKVKFDRASVVFCRPVKLHDRSCETSFQTLILTEILETSDVSISIIAYQCICIPAFWSHKLERWLDTSICFLTVSECRNFKIVGHASFSV